MGHGPPTYFITLSCAEYFWPDVINLLRDRLRIARIDDSDCYEGSPKLVQLVNDYSIVIQEYFQKRTIAWLETVGKEIFDIKYYWVRYEFAPGRGQIHAHLLAIPSNHDIYKVANQPNINTTEKANIMADWASETFGLTATVTDDFETIDTSASPNPVTVRFSDLPDDEPTIAMDIQRLLKTCEIHECSRFCMRDGNANR